MTEKEKLIEALVEDNPWWKGRFQLDYKPREIYLKIKEFLKIKQILALTGLRRVGKTTLLFKMVEDYLDADFSREQIIYFSFDEFGSVPIKEVLKTYADFMNKDLNEGRFFILFDEIQKLENWEEQLKRIYDHHLNFKIIISGSESLFIRKKSRESLAGRFFEFEIKTLSFSEFLTFEGKAINNILLYREELLKSLKEYLLCSGFPELIDVDKEIVKKYIKENLIEKIIYRDIPQVFPVKEPALLDQIFSIILHQPGEILNFDSLAKELGVSRQTVSSYINYLEKAFLVKKLYNFSKNIRKTQRKLKKYYPTLILPELLEKPEKIGKLFETFLVLQLEAEFFWRDTFKNEVDVIMLVDQQIRPIEIKYAQIETKPLKAFMKKFHLSQGRIITYDKKEEIKFDQSKIDVVPFYEVLLNRER